MKIPIHYWVYTAALALAFFSGSAVILARLPGSDGVSCGVGLNLNVGNLVFAGLLSIFTALFFLGLYLLNGKSKVSGSLFGVGFFGAFFTMFCAACTLPALSTFGVALGLSFFAAHQVLIQSVSLSMMVFALWLLNRRLQSCNCSL